MAAAIIITIISNVARWFCAGSCADAKTCVTDPEMKVKYEHICGIYIIKYQRTGRAATQVPDRSRRSPELPWPAG